MAIKLYVGGLPWKTTDEELQAAFSECGTVVSATVMRDRMTGRSRGFGFVEMSDEGGADAAVAKWNGQDFDGRRLTVNPARPPEPRGDRGGFRQ